MVMLKSYTNSQPFHPEGLWCNLVVVLKFVDLLGKHIFMFITVEASLCLENLSFKIIQMNIAVKCFWLELRYQTKCSLFACNC